MSVMTVSRPPTGWDADAVVREVRQEELTALRQTRETHFLWATCWLLRRADLGGEPLFDERCRMYDEDLDLCHRLRRRGRTLLYCPQVEFVHLDGASSTPAAKPALMRRARARYHAVHQGRTVAAP